MRRLGLPALVVATTLLMGGSMPTPLQRPNLQHELDALTQRGYTYRFLSNDLIELTDPVSAEKYLKSLREPSEAEIRSWARARGVPILEIDPALIDTTQYAGWYDYWQQLPISGAPGQPVVVADVDGNDNPEIYGLVTIAGSPTIIEARVCEVDPPTFRYTYLPYPGIPTGIVDIDADSLREILFAGQSGSVLTDYVQQQTDSLPTTLNFLHPTTNSGFGISYAAPVVGSLDDDARIDCLYKVGEIDSSDTTFPVVNKVIVEEYDSAARNLQRVWAMRLPPAGQPLDAIGHLASADFDQDGKQEFVTTGGLEGSVFLCENTGDNSYGLIYQDSVPFVNLYRVTTGDVDDDGKPEFFAVATQGNGQWALMYEADSSDHYSMKLLIHFVSGGSIDEPTYLVSDIDGDGRLELLTTSGPNVFMLKTDGDNSYRLWYYRREDRLNAVQAYDFNGDGEKDLVISKDSVDQQGQLQYYSDLYRATALLSVDEDRSLPLRIQLLRNYPNPFNPMTTIKYSLPFDSNISLNVFDILGREVVSLVDGFVEAGYHQVSLDATNLASGIYFYRLEAGTFRDVKKLVILR